MGNLTANVHPGIIRISPPAYTGSYTVTPDEQGEVLETNGKVMTDDVTVNPVPWVKPEGTKNITTNGTHNIEAYETANVQVPQGVFPTGTLDIGENGTYDVTNYASAEVNTDPVKGFVFDNFDSDGKARRLRLIGFTEVAEGVFSGYAKASTGYLGANITEVILNPELESIARNSLVGLSGITQLILPNVNYLINNTFRGATSLEYVEFQRPLMTGQLYLSFDGCSNIKQVIFKGNITTTADNFWFNPFNGNTKIELYDFSQCTNVFVLPNATYLPHASGCVIRVPAAKLTEWQNATNWNALTDVVWEGV